MYYIWRQPCDSTLRLSVVFFKGRRDYSVLQGEVHFTLQVFGRSASRTIVPFSCDEFLVTTYNFGIANSVVSQPTTGSLYPPGFRGSLPPTFVTSSTVVGASATPAVRIASLPRINLEEERLSGSPPCVDQPLLLFLFGSPPIWINHLQSSLLTVSGRRRRPLITTASALDSDPSTRQYRCLSSDPVPLYPSDSTVRSSSSDRLQTSFGSSIHATSATKAYSAGAHRRRLRQYVPLQLVRILASSSNFESSRVENSGRISLTLDYSFATRLAIDNADPKAHAVSPHRTNTCRLQHYRSACQQQFLATSPPRGLN